VVLASGSVAATGTNVIVSPPLTKTLLCREDALSLS
jgi:hypothetical protein